MSDYIWVSGVFINSSLQRGFHLDIWSDGRSPSRTEFLVNYNGLPVDMADLPQKIWAYDDQPPIKQLPDAFDLTDVVLISERAAHIFQRFDLGHGGVYPMQEGIFQKNRETLFSDAYSSWVIGNTKTAFLADETPEKRKLGVSGTRWSYPFTNCDDNIAVSRDALDGPDQWVDTKLFRAVFLSAQLGDALVEAGLREPFFLNRCRVL